MAEILRFRYDAILFHFVQQSKAFFIICITIIKTDTEQYRVFGTVPLLTTLLPMIYAFSYLPLLV